MTTDEGKIAALETFVEEILPILIAASPNKQAAVEQLEEWANTTTSDPYEVELGNLADSVLKLIPTR